MNTIKIFLAESGRIADLLKDFPLYKGQFNDKLLNVYVPTSILAPQFDVQHYIGQNSGADLPTSDELASFVAENTYPSREPAQGDIVEFYDTETQKYYIYQYNGSLWTSTEVDSFGTLNTIAGTSVKIGMLAIKRNGAVYESKSYFMRYLKTLTYQGTEYALYERKLPKEFTSFVGQGANAPTLIMNVVNVDTADSKITSLITSQTCHLDVMESTMLDQDETIEAGDLENLEAQVNENSAKIDLKQDKIDNSLDTTSKSVVGAINSIYSTASTNTTNIATNTSDISDIKTEQQTQNNKISTNEDNIATNTSNISSLQSRVSSLENTSITGETYIGTMTGSSLPTSTQLTNYVNTTADRQPKGGDYVYFILEISGETDKNYKYTYSSVSGWDTGAEIPSVEPADNGSMGIVEGTYGDSNQNSQFNISNGKILSLHVKDNSNSMRDVREYLNSSATTLANNVSQTNTNTGNISTQGGKITTLEGQMANILNGTTAVGAATKATNDSLNRNISSTYLTQSAGATKQQLYDYALPRAFNDVSFVGANNAFVDTVPESTSPLYTVTTSAVDDYEIFYAQKTISNAQFQLGSKNSYTSTLYVTASTDCTVSFRVITELYINNDWVILNAELTDPVTLTANTIRRINFGSPFNYLNDVLNVADGDIIKQTFEVSTESSTSTTFSVYSNETYPSTFYLNTTAQTIFTSQGDLGEIPVYNLYGTLSSGTITFTVPSSLAFNENVIALFRLNYLDPITAGTYIKLSYDLQDVRLVTPYNFTSNANATIENLQQAYIGSEGLLFAGLIQEENGDLFVLTNIKNFPLFETSTSNIKMDGTASVGSLSTVARADHIHPSDTSKQDVLPTTSTAGKVLKSTSTAGTMEWGDLPSTSNTWRPIQVDGVQKLSNDPSGSALNLVAGDNVTLSESNGAVTISSQDTIVEYSVLPADENGEAESLVTTGEKYVWDSKQDSLEDVLPDDLSSDNKIASEGFVNSSVATNTANFFGTFSNYKELMFNAYLTAGSILAAGSYITAGSSGYDEDYIVESNLTLDEDLELNVGSLMEAGSRIEAGSVINRVLYNTTTILENGEQVLESDPTNNDYAFVVNSVIPTDFADTTALDDYTAENIDYLTNYDYAWVENGNNFDLYRWDMIEGAWDLRVQNTAKNAVTLNTAYNRYKFVEDFGQWVWEYTLNNSSFTAAQWAAINSGATSTNIGQIATNTGNISSLSSNKADKTATVSNVSYDSQNKKLQQTINGSTTDVVTFGSNAFNSTTIPTTYVSSVNGQSGTVTGLQPTISAGTGISISSNTVSLNGVIPYTTTAPTAVNSTGVKIAILSSEPATKYAGWLYFITE